MKNATVTPKCSRYKVTYRKTNVSKKKTVHIPLPGIEHRARDVVLTAVQTFLRLKTQSHTSILVLTSRVFLFKVLDTIL